MGNPHGTHMKQVDKPRMGPIWVEMWARSGKMWAISGTHMGNLHGTHVEQVDKTHMGPKWVAQMGPI